MFLVGFFNVILTIKKKKIIKAFNIRISSLKIKFIILNKFAIVS